MRVFSPLRHWFATATMFVLPAVGFADQANCAIEIDDVNAATKYRIEHTFVFEKGGFSQRKEFSLPGSDFNCTLAFHDLSTGTMLSCAYKKNPFGEPYVQSDRTGIDEDNATNHLTFKIGETFVSIESHCNGST